MQPFEFSHLFFKDFGRLGVPFLFLGPFAQFLNILVLHVAAQLLLNGADLLLQEMFPLLLVEVFARLGLNVGLDLQQLSLLGKHLVELVEAVLDVVDIEQFLFLGGRQRYVGPQEINQVVGHCRCCEWQR